MSALLESPSTPLRRPTKSYCTVGYRSRVTDHLWTQADRRRQLGEVLRHARWIKKHYKTDAFDDIITTCQRFRVQGFSDADLKKFSRSVGTPPGWVHPRGDARVPMEMEHPRLMAHLDALKQVLEDLLTMGYRD